MADENGGIDFPTEGRLALEDVSFALLSGEISSSLPLKKEQVYLNLTTRENAKFCVCLNHSGFQVVGRDHDLVSTTDEDSSTANTYESIYSLLENISPSYSKQFSHQLFQKLSKHISNTQ